MEIEQHPLEPFLPGNARLLMLGSFPPQRKRWSMEFYYPNWNNDMWRIAGLLFFNDKDHFADKSQKAFRKERIIDFLNEKGIALFDTATAVRRLQDNASDKYLEVVRPPTYPHYCNNCHSAKRLSLRDKKLPTRSVRCSHCKNLKSGILRNSFSQTALCGSTACPLHQELIRWL